MALTFLLISIGLILVSLFSFGKKLERVRSKYGEAFNFALTLVATLVGVFLGIAFTQQAEKQDDEDRVKNLLEVAIHNLNDVGRNAETTLIPLRVSPDSTAYARLDSFLTYEITYPEIAKNLTQHDLVLETISPQTLGYLSGGFHRLDRGFRKLQSFKGSRQAGGDLLRDYSKDLFFLQHVIAGEILLLNEKLSEKEVQKGLNEINQRSRSNTTELTELPGAAGQIALVRNKIVNKFPGAE